MIKWYKSSLSGQGADCVEVAELADGRWAVRDSEDPNGPVLEFGPSQWKAFIGGAKLGEFDN